LLRRRPPALPGERHTWTAADKHGFGTATQLGSHTWFTLRQAELTEVYYPDLGTPSLRQLEFVVTDGKSFVDRETGPRVSSRVEAIPGSLTFRQVTQTRRWRLTKTWIADPARDAVLGTIRFRSLTGRKLRLYLLVDPAPSDDGNDDRGSRLGHGAAWDDTVASVVAADPRIGRHTSGYAGSASDPWADLRRDGDLDRSYEATQPGNIVQAARTWLTGTRGRDSMTLAIGFGSEAAGASHTALGSLEAGFGRAARAYAAGWAAYLGSVNEPPRSINRSTFLRRVYDQSVMVLEASEDKTHRGASIASPTMPWVWGTLTLSGPEFSGPYLVWPRDLYHVATAQQALGDEAAAIRLLEYLWRVQKPDGSWWQNTEVSGEPHWTGTQMGEVSLPIVLAWWLGRTSQTDWQHVRAAADNVVANGPYTPQERWENQDGWSPNTIATEIAGLICAADIARKHGDAARAVRYEATADEWQRGSRTGPPRTAPSTTRPPPTMCASRRTPTRTTARTTTSATTSRAP
jgi:glucoamylase